jgi:dinuclear metal center YbgI/SA1388 family protein
MKIAEVVRELEVLADPALQEHYDNAGLITGNTEWDCSGIVCCLDATEEVIKEAVSKQANLVIAHHPIIFSGLKKINGKNYVERSVITAIKNDIAVYAIHTNIDNINNGVSGYMAELMGLKNCRVLDPKKGLLKKFVTYVPASHAEETRNALFKAGGGEIGNYSECSFNAEGFGTFKPGSGTNPFVGKTGEQHRENEIRIEMIMPDYLEKVIISALREIHPYEEPAYDILQTGNEFQKAGSGIIGELETPVTGTEFLGLVKSVFHARLVRHTRLIEKKVKRIALCGGAGSFLIPKALASGADAFITGDMKYHEFFDANDKMIIADPGHFETEQFTIDLLQSFLAKKFLTFAVLKTGVLTNPVYYY